LRLSDGMRRPVSTGRDTLPRLDVLEAQVLALVGRLTYLPARPKIPGKCDRLAVWPQKKAARMDSERRRAPRYRFVADAEVIAPGTNRGARTSDVSIGGCFLDMPNPLPEGTEIRVRISQASATFAALGRVVFIFPNMGMGVVFTRVEDDQLPVLQEWLSELSRGG
jgi:PilZ domain